MEQNPRAPLYHAFGLDVSRRHNLQYLSVGDVSALAYLTGNCVNFWELPSLKRRYLFSIGGCGIGAFVVHPTHEFVVVGERGVNPDIYVYEYPSLKLSKRLVGGGVEGFSCMSFSGSGAKLATVSTKPDYLLTIWDWRTGRMLLHSKAFGQDVYSVSFSPNDEDRLTTSGTGHIRFWKMASTFTGLKLQGDIGKFGKVELSDIAQFAEMPDGKVVSSTDSGALLLWEGNFIKYRVLLAPGQNCHEGEVTYLALRAEEGLLVTAGADGWVRCWEVQALMEAEALEDGAMDVYLAPVHELRVAPNGEASCVQALVLQKCANDMESKYLALDVVRGELLQFAQSALIPTVPCSVVESSSLNSQTLMTFHCGGVTGLACSPLDSFAATCGLDGTVRCWDYVARRELYSAQHTEGATCLSWAPLALDASCRTVVVGFADGAVRVLYRAQKSWLRVQAFKPHNGRVLCAVVSPDGLTLATCGDDGKVFLLKTSKFCVGETPKQYAPLGLVKQPQMPGCAVTCVRWRRDSRAALFTCADGQLFECDLAALASEEEHEQGSFEIKAPLTRFSLKLPPKEEVVVVPAQAQVEEGSSSLVSSSSSSSEVVVSEVEAEIIEAEEQLVSCAAYAPAGSSLLMAGVQKAGAYFCFDEHHVAKQRLPVLCCEPAHRHVTVTSIELSQCEKFVLSAHDDGGVTVRAGEVTFKNCAQFVRVQAHDGTARVSQVALSHDAHFLLSAGDDGLLIVHRVQLDAPFEEQARAVCDSKKKKKTVATQGDSTTTTTTTTTTAHSTPQELTAVSASSSCEEEEDLQSVELPRARTLVVEVPDGEAFSPESGSEEVFAVVDSGVRGDAHDTLKEQTQPVAKDVQVGAYSLEDEKRKSDEDAQCALAERKKEVVRSVIRAMRRDFKELSLENASLPLEQRLDSVDLVIDPEYVARLEEQGEVLLDSERRRRAYDSEKSRVRLKKLKEFFLSELEKRGAHAMEGQSMRCIKSEHKVGSFRATQLSAHLKQCLNKVHAAMRVEDLAEHRRADSAVTSSHSNDRRGSQQVVQQSAQQARCDLLEPQQTAQGGGGVGVSPGETNKSGSFKQQQQQQPVKQSGSTSEWRKTARASRKEALAALLGGQPAEDADDPRDLEAIERSKRDLGDYKLKSALDYEVPRDQQLSALKKRTQLMMLQENVNSIKTRYNRRFLALRDVKRLVVQSMVQGRQRTLELELRIKQALRGHASANDKRFVFNKASADEEDATASSASSQIALRLEEWPDVARSLAPNDRTAFAKCRTTTTTCDATPEDRVLEASSAASLKEEKTTGGSDSKVKVVGLLLLSERETRVVREHPALAFVPGIAALRRLELGFATSAALRAVPPPPPNPLQPRRMMSSGEQFERFSVACRLRHEVDCVARTICEHVGAFDSALKELRKEHIPLAADLKAAELRLLLLLQELSLLQTFELKDTSLKIKLDKTRNDQRELDGDLGECLGRLAAKKGEHLLLVKAHEQLSADFKQIVPDSHSFVLPLLKAFKRKIKRVKKKNSENANGDEDEDEDCSDEEEDDLDDEEEDEEDEADETCPAGCDATLYEHVIELREKRLDQEEVLTDFARVIDDLKRAAERHAQRKKQIDRDLESFSKELRSFQTEKQQHLNQLHTVCSLQLHQVHLFEEEGARGDGENLANDAAKTVHLTLQDDDASSSSSSSHLDSASLAKKADMATAVLFSRVCLEQRHNRISALECENKAERANFKELHRVKLRLERAKVVREAQIASLRARCEDLQMLKFGQLIQLELLDRDSAATKVEEVSNLKVKVLEHQHLAQLRALEHRQTDLRENLLHVTRDNTDALAQIAALSTRQFALEKKLGTGTGSGSSSQGGSGTGNKKASGSIIDSAPTIRREVEERNRLVALVRLQGKEIDALKAEINLLRRKGGHVYVPAPTNAKPAQQQDNLPTLASVTPGLA